MEKMEELSQIEEELNGVKSRIDAYFDVIEGDVDVYIESLKAKLDSIRESFMIKIRDGKRDVERLSRVNEIEQKLKNNDDISDESEEILNDLKGFDFKVKLTLNEKNLEINDDYIGSFEYKIPLSRKLLNSISQIETVSLDIQPEKIVKLKNNNNILISSYEDECLCLYNSEDFTLQRRIDELNNDYKIRPSVLVADCDDNIYVPEWSNGFTCKYDNDFKYMKSILIDYHDLCIYDNKLYATLRGTDEIHVLTLEFELISKHKLNLNCNSAEIRIVNNVACVLNSNGYFNSAICFFKLPTFELIVQHNKHSGILFNCDHWFYTLSPFRVCVFNINGKLIEDKCMVNEIEDFNIGSSVVVIEQSETMIISLNKKKIGKIKLK